MEITQAPEAATAQPTETPDTNPQIETGKQTQPDGKKSTGGKDVGERIHRLLEKEKEPGYQHSDEDLDFLENEYYSGKNKPTKPLSVEKEEPDEGSPESELEGDDKDPEEKPKEEKAKLPKEVEDAMKEVGAKDPSELPGKIKELRKQLSGKDAQAVATLTKQINAEKMLMEDVAKGVPEAIDHFRKVYGLEVVRPGQHPPAQQVQNPQQPSADTLPFTPEDDALVGGALSRMYAMVQASQKTLGGIQETFQQQQERIQSEAAKAQARNETIDQLTVISQGYPELKSIPNIRALLNEWADGTQDPRLEPLNELFEIAQREGVSLIHAAKIKRAEEADRLIAEAEARGRESAYKHKPNPSLSGLTGGKGETIHYTEEQINEMVNDHTKHPEDWYDENDNLIPSRIPKRWRSKFGFRE